MIINKAGDRVNSNLKVRVNSDILIDIVVDDSFSCDCKDIQSMLTLFLLLDSNNRSKVISVLKGMFLGQETDKGESIDFEYLRNI